MKLLPLAASTTSSSSSGKNNTSGCGDNYWPENFVFPNPNQVVSQWIDQVLEYSSQYGSGRDRNKQFCASQIIGPPRVKRYGDNGLAWAPRYTGRNEWLVVKLARPVRISQVKIRETLCGGAFHRLQLLSPISNEWLTAAERLPRCGQYPRIVRIENIEIPDEESCDDFVTDTLRFEFICQGGNDWYEIDAIQVIGTTSVMEEMINDPQNQQRRFENNKVSTDIATKLWKDTTTADCALILSQDNNTRIPIHRGILAARCPFFRKMIDNEELPLGGEQTIQGITKPIMDRILEWIYTGNLTYDDDDDDDEFQTKAMIRESIVLATASDYFQINDLTEYCINIYVRGALSVTNVVELYCHFDKLGCIILPLQRAVLEYMAKHFRQVSQTPHFAKLTQPQLLALIECYNNQLQELDEKTAAEAEGEVSSNNQSQQQRGGNRNNNNNNNNAGGQEEEVVQMEDGVDDNEAEEEEGMDEDIYDDDEEEDY